MGRLREISLVGSVIEYVVVNPVNPNVVECYAINAIKSVVPTFQENIGIDGIDLTKGTYPYTDRKTVTITFHNEQSNPSITFDLEDIGNQAGWTPDFAGLQQAVSDICGWISAGAGSTAGLATEVTLDVLATPVTGLALGGPFRRTDATGSPITAGKRRISVMNTGAADGSANGGTIKPGEVLTWVGDGLRDTLAAMAYDGTGTELLITTVG